MIYSNLKILPDINIEVLPSLKLAIPPYFLQNFVIDLEVNI
jgi:hypothetical protein